MNSMNPTTYNELSKYAYFILCVQLYSISSLSSAGNGETFKFLVYCDDCDTCSTVESCLQKAF